MTFWRGLIPLGHEILEEDAKGYGWDTISKDY